MRRLSYPAVLRLTLLASCRTPWFYVTLLFFAGPALIAAANADPAWTSWQVAAWLVVCPPALIGVTALDVYSRQDEWLPKEEDDS